MFTGFFKYGGIVSMRGRMMSSGQCGQSFLISGQEPKM